MEKHNRTEPGLSLIKKDALDLIANSGTSDFWGFAPKEALELLLQGTGCVGLRVYNAFNEDNDDTLVIAAITEAGDEIQQTVDGKPGYTVSSKKSDDGGGAWARQVDRATAKTIAEHSVQLHRFVFASFFSIEAIQKLLENPNCNGLNFYNVRSNGFSPFSHLAIPAEQVAASNEVQLVGNSGEFIQCPEPCPPRCIPEDPVVNPVSARNIPDSQTTVAAAPADSQIAMTKYLINW